MSNDNKELKNVDLNNNESCEGKRELTPEELDQVTGGVTNPNVAGVIGKTIATGVFVTLVDGIDATRK